MAFPLLCTVLAEKIIKDALVCTSSAIDVNLMFVTLLTMARLKSSHACRA